MSALYSDLKDASVFVTGGGSGIGAGIVEAFCRQGSTVAFVDIDAEASERLCQKLTDQGLKTPAFKTFDLTQLDHIESVIAELAETTGPFRVLVNNAASDNRHTPEEVTPEYWKNRIDVNLSQQFFCAKAAAPAMKAAGKGSIINFGSVSYSMALPDLVAYATCKAATTGLTRSLARDWGSDGIRVNTLTPGCIMTEKQLKMWITPEAEAAIQEKQCIKTRLLPEDVAQMVLFLASDASRTCTAQDFVVDGGII